MTAIKLMTGNTRLSLLDEIRQSMGSDRWDEFAKEYGKIISGWLIRQQVDAHDADDVQQEVMAVVLKELAKFQHNGRPGAFRSWLRQIMVNRLRQLWKKRKSSKVACNLEALADELVDDSSRLSIAWEKEHNNHLVSLLLKRAETRFQKNAIDIFQMVAIESIPAVEVADRFGVSVGSVRVQQHRILRFLKQVGSGLVEI